MSYILERPHRNDRLRELENLRKQVNDLEIEIRGQNHKSDREDSLDDPDYVPNRSSRGSGRVNGETNHCRALS
nr:hypothetical protein CFP56_67237 [Quercus suber]